MPEIRSRHCAQQYKNSSKIYFYALLCDILNAETDDLAANKANKTDLSAAIGNINSLAYGINPEQYPLVVWASDSPYRRSIWKISGRAMTGTPDDTSEWCCLNFQDNNKIRGIVIAIEYGGTKSRIMTRPYFEGAWLENWRSLRE